MLIIEIWRMHVYCMSKVCVDYGKMNMYNIQQLQMLQLKTKNVYLLLQYSFNQAHFRILPRSYIQKQFYFIRFSDFFPRYGENRQWIVPERQTDGLNEGLVDIQG